MKIAYRPQAIDHAPSEEIEDFVVENSAGMVLRATKSRCLRLGFTEDEIDCAIRNSSEDVAFIACPRARKESLELMQHGSNTDQTGSRQTEAARQAAQHRAGECDERGA